MLLSWLELTAVRCYPKLRVEPDPGVNLFIGPNGAGKTTLLEAVGYLSRMTSFRRVADAVLIATGRDRAVLRGEFRTAISTTNVDVEIPSAGRRRVLVNGKRPARLRAVAAELPVVTFLPDDLELVKGSPSRRREYLDDLGAQLWPAAAAEQDDYETALRQRNALLRREGRAAAPAELDVWDRQVAAAGSALVARRLEVLGRLTVLFGDLYEGLHPGGARLEWTYASTAWEDAGIDRDEMAGRLLDALAARRVVDLERRVTTVGPHRDHLDFLAAGRNTRTHASQGEQRAAALVLRLAAYELLAAHHGFPPLLLLDDVFSEFDPERSRAVVARLPGAQVLITSARAEDVPVTGRTWRVDDGTVAAA